MKDDSIWIPQDSRRYLDDLCRTQEAEKDAVLHMALVLLHTVIQGRSEGYSHVLLCDPVRREFKEIEIDVPASDS